MNIVGGMEFWKWGDPEKIPTPYTMDT
jgi:hypothetical protein